MNFKQHKAKPEENHYGLISQADTNQRRSIGVARNNSDVGNNFARRNKGGPHQETATSDFLNRFKGKISTISGKDGVSGVIASASKPIEIHKPSEGLDKVGFRSGMTSLSYAVPAKQTVESEMDPSYTPDHLSMSPMPLGAVSTDLSQPRRFAVNTNNVLDPSV